MAGLLETGHGTGLSEKEKELKEEASPRTPVQTGHEAMVTLASHATHT